MTPEQRESMAVALGMAVAALNEDAAADIVLVGEAYRADGGDPRRLAGAAAGTCANLARLCAGAVGRDDEGARIVLRRVAEALAGGTG